MKKVRSYRYFISTLTFHVEELNQGV